MPKKSAKQSWFRRIEAARKARDRQKVMWDRNLSMLVPRSTTRAVNRNDLVKLAWSAFQTMVGAVYGRNPDPLIRANKAEFEDTAKLFTEVVKHDFAVMDTRSPVRLALQDVFYAGFGVIMENHHSDVSAVSMRFGKEEVQTLEPRNQRYSHTRVHPAAILFDPKASKIDLSDCMWLALEFYPTIKELRESEEFTISEETLAKLPRLTSSPQTSQQPGQDQKWKNKADDSGNEDAEFDQVRVYEIWDRVNQERLYMPAGFDEIISRGDWPVELRLNGVLQYPLATVWFNENAEDFWPIPELSLIAPQIEQFAVLFKQILKDAVTKWRKFVVQGQYLQKGHVDRLINGPTHQVMSVDNTNVPGNMLLDLKNVVMPIPDPAVQQDQMVVLNLVKQLLHEIVGAGDFASAGFRSTRSATEAAALSDFLRSRMSNRTENVDSFFKRLVTIHCLYLQNTLTEERAIRISDVNGMPVWQAFKGDNLTGDLSFEVISGSSMPQNTELFRQEAISFYQQTLPPLMQVGGNAEPLIRWIAPFFKMPDAVIDRMFNNHRQALMELAKVLFAAGQGDPAAGGAVLLESAAVAVKTGLTVSEIQNLLMSMQQSAPAQAQPGGMPGTNNSQQTIPAG